MNSRNKKITILGAGHVGASIAFSMIIDGMASEILFVDINRDKAEGEVLDLKQAAVFCPSVKIGCGDYADAKDSDIIIVTLGIARKPGQSRIDLAQTNVNIIKQVMPQVAKVAPNAIYVIVSNPVDILTYATIKCTGLSPKQVIGTGTLLDTIRLSESVSEYLGVSSRSCHSYVLGEHGDTSMVPWSFVSIAGLPIVQYCKTQLGKSEEEVKHDLDEMLVGIRNSGAKIIKLKGATYYAIALTVRKICDALFRNANCIMPLSTLLDGQHGMKDVCISIPCMVNSDGVKQAIELPMSNDELAKLKDSYKAMKDVIEALEI